MRGYQFSLGFLILGCATSRQQIPVREGRDATIGCYQFDRPHWTSLTLFGNSDSVASSIPPVFVELHQTGRVTPALHVLGSGFAPLEGEWRRVRRDSLRIWWSDGMTVVDLSLEPRGDSLAGTGVLRAYHVTGVESPTTNVTGRKRSCG